MGLITGFFAAFSVAIDAFVGSLAYGTNKIRIPLKPALLINLICTSCFFFSYILGSILKGYIAEQITIIISFLFLFIIGLIKLLDWYIKKLIRNWSQKDKKISFSMFNIKFILSLYANPEKADVDKSRDLSTKEAIPLGIAVGIDGVIVGLALSLINTNIFYLLFCSITLHAMAIFLGCFIGKTLAYKTNWDINWLGGSILIILAITRFI